MKLKVIYIGGGVMPCASDPKTVEVDENQTLDAFANPRNSGRPSYERWSVMTDPYRAMNSSKSFKENKIKAGATINVISNLE